MPDLKHCRDHFFGPRILAAMVVLSLFTLQNPLLGSLACIPELLSLSGREFGPSPLVRRPELLQRPFVDALIKVIATDGFTAFSGHLSMDPPPSSFKKDLTTS